MDETTQVTPIPTPPPTPSAGSGTGSNKMKLVAVIEAVVIILLVFTSAVGWYMYWQKSNSPVVIPVTSTTPPLPSENGYQNPFDASQSALPAYQNPFATQ